MQLYPNTSIILPRVASIYSHTFQKDIVAKTHHRMSHLHFTCLVLTPLSLIKKITFMKRIDPYLNFIGQSTEAMKFYQSVFGGNFVSFQRYKDVPGAEKMSAEVQDQIVHASLSVGGANMIMATDAVDTMEQELVSGNNIYLCIHAESESEADKLFEGLSKNGKIEIPMNIAFWGAYFGMCMDKFGIHWMISYEGKNVNGEENKER